MRLFCFQVLLFSFISVFNAEERLAGEFSDLHPAEMNILPYAQSLGYGLPYEQIPGLLGFGLQGIGGMHSSGNLHGAYNGLGASAHGYHDDSSFGKHGFTKGAGGAGFGLHNGFGGLYGAKEGYGNQFIGGNSNTFAKEKVFSQNKNFGSGSKGGFGTGYGVQGGLHGHGGYGGFGGLSSIGQVGLGAQGLYTGATHGAGGFGHQTVHNDASLHGKGLAAAG